MRKVLPFLFVLAALTALVSCVRTQPEEIVGGEATVQFTVGVPETRTAFTTPEGDSYPVLWTASDTEVKISLKMLAVESATVTPAPDGKSATFSASFESGYQAPYSFYLFSPASAYDRALGVSWRFVVKEEQTPTAQSVDEKAQILVAEAKGFTEMPRTVNFSLKHWTAYGILSFEHLELGSAHVTGVELTAEKPLAGGWSYNVDEGSSEILNGVNTLKINTTSTAGIWFACAPADLSNTTLKVKVLTDKGFFVKEVALPADRNLTSGKVARITVDMAGITPQVPGVMVQRVWGKYSTAEASWNEYFGGTPNTDRNLALDDDFIYLSETTSAAKLWQIGLDGASITEANVEGVSGGTFALSCVRMMPNNSLQANGGADFLMGVSLTVNDSSQPVYIYSYDQGTDKAPKRTSASTWCGRRLGDKFTVFGSLQDGGLFFKDYENIQSQGAFMVLKTAWSVAPVDGYFNPRRTNMIPETGVGAYYPYPNDVQHGIYTSTSAGWYVSFGESPLVVTPNESMTKRDAGGYYKDAHGINFFEFNGKRYIAYAKNAGGGDGRFYILEGETTDSWESLLDGKRKVIYQAAIQHDTEFHDSVYHAELEVPSPRYSGNSGLDVAMRECNGVVYFAVVKQNVGLSLFKMSIE